ncbi:hypothetical protein HXX76_016332 [Chlamydomonas incerta]|uniref:RNB domain-containing protein n=1 Tax=Chlamydomonas incerta TaxID=51695 RepID=A0A835VQQ9_CHLIN|nr:hypothetical protein HXX76_016332 [Chlamydomonas incerta]|eukprot:KAG2422006.1 hypothetical protein HXX76_016332 [Chlamydomonas incerta]
MSTSSATDGRVGVDNVEHASALDVKAMGRRHNEPKIAAAASAGASKDNAAPTTTGHAEGEAAGTGSRNGAGARGKTAVAKEATPGRYAEHLDQAELQRGFKTGQVFRGKIRVNAGDRREAYITIPGLPHDVLLRGDACQNRAVEGDEVAVALQPLAAWFTVTKLAAQLPPGTSSNDAVMAALKGCGADLSDDSPWQRCGSADEVKALVTKLSAARPELRITGKVVAILTPSPKREHVVGLLQLGAPAAGVAPLSAHPLSAAVAALQAAGSSSGSASTVPSSAVPTCYLMPLDPRLPRCVVRPSELKNLPTALLEELMLGPEKAENRTLMSARIAEWSSSHNQPAVTLRASLGQAGEIESETAALLEMEGIRSADFEPDVHAHLSIDPPTAKDLDDALSISPLPGGGWRVGVHIADVAHFIPPFSALDVEAASGPPAPNSVQRVIPMLPPLLCEELCSLNPGVERLGVQLEWELDAKGEARRRHQVDLVGRSVIRSCTKLSYPLVQAMIEGRFDPATCPVQLHGGPPGTRWSATAWRCGAWPSRCARPRFAGGALRLDGVRLFYQLDKDGNPLAAAPYVPAAATPPPNAAKLKVLQEDSTSYAGRLPWSHGRPCPPPNNPGSRTRGEGDDDLAVDGSLKLYLCVLLRRQPVVTMGTVSSLGVRPLLLALYIPEFGHEVRLELEEAGVPLQGPLQPGHQGLFSDLPVVLTAVSVPGEPSQLVARMYLPVAEEAAAAMQAGEGR